MSKIDSTGMELFKSCSLLVFGLVFLLVDTAKAAPQVKLGSIEVTNGGRDGTWGLFELCPSGSTTIGVSLRVDYTTSGDQRGVTGIKLHCNDGASINETFITSSFVDYGTWGSRMDCIGFHVPVAFRLRVLPENQETARTDKTGLNNISFKCDNDEEFVGYGTYQGEWGAYSEACFHGICGLTTKVQPEGGFLTDNTAVNDVKFLCC